ncbi:hypothetical protein IVB34_47380 [Bradyrhizobium sp. 2]|uniref:hypothetical protein n=1 Tax=Bradyrhizobium sp. 2 TaxID=190045 RepID=UPI001FFC1A92|nr:hypothetical protein [Bradyrhizobium sp. 2]MCK1465715.1 hypothetical protein [Bradyrhizobium sp. 2]
MADVGDQVVAALPLATTAERDYRPNFLTMLRFILTGRETIAPSWQLWQSTGHRSPQHPSDAHLSGKDYGGYRRHLSALADGYATTDGATVTNGAIDVVARKIAPTISADTYSTAATGTLANDAISQGGITQRQAIASTSLANITGNKIRVTFTPPSAGNTTLSNVYVGHAGTAPNFDGNQVRLTFNGGNNGVTLYGGGPAVVSDAVTFTYDHTKTLITSMDITGTSSARNNSATGADFTLYFKSADSANVGATTVTGYSTAATTARVVSKVEILTATGTTQNITVVTTAQTADASSSNVRVLIAYEQVNAITLNTDLTVEVSCNGGTNWSAAALSLTGTGQDGRSVAETGDQSCTAGTSIQARIKVFNNKLAYIHGMSLSWH